MRREKDHIRAALDRSRVRAVLFDVDGTLSDSDDRMVDTIRGWIEPLRGIFGEEKLHRFARWVVKKGEGPGNFVLETADRLGIDPLFAKFLDQRARADEPMASILDYPVIQGVHDMLARLSGQYELGVVSARNELTTRLFLRLNALEKYFPVVVTSQTCTHTKPFPDPLYFAAKQLGVKVNECLMVGDTVIDVRAALAAKSQSVSVLCGFGTEAELIKAGTHALLKSTGDLADLLMGGSA